MDRDTVWSHIHQERAALRETLAGLSPEQWEHDSLCAGWTVKDVAVHVISIAWTGWPQLAGMAGRNLGRGYNTLVYRETKRVSAGRSPESILADYTTYADSRHHVPTTTSIEPLIDVLVHHQDILRPLGLQHDMNPAAAARAADRGRHLAFLSGTRKLVKGTRLVATDIDWARGTGPTIEGPMQELLMLIFGRGRVATGLTGDGLEQVVESSR